MYLKGRQEGVHEAEEIVFVADGVRWIWSVVEEHFADAVQIVDWYHAVKHILEVANTVYGEGGDAGQEWAEEQLDGLWEGDLTHVLQALRA